MRVLICGDTSWTDRKAIKEWLSKLQDWGYTDVIEGEAKGADTIAKEEALAMNMGVIGFPAQWSKYGRRAGPIRNKEMAKIGKPDLILAFCHAPPEKGTAGMIEIGKKTGIEVIIVEK